MAIGILVRDKIPEIISREGRTPITHIASDDEYWEILKGKLREEIDEYYNSGEEEDFIDILDVIDSMTEFKKYNKGELEVLRKKKEEERGSYSKRVILDDFDKLTKFM
ncbi:nucleoside triphosphate pyrophosphohydrolase [Candidatus Pacearchaeota archaeon]|nr:nucleoside triphosphate pyrophosphohydrolase [Candidatus Pacearchaeota archaeon]